MVEGPLHATENGELRQDTEREVGVKAVEPGNGGGVHPSRLILVELGETIRDRVKIAGDAIVAVRGLAGVQIKRRFAVGEEVSIPKDKGISTAPRRKSQKKAAKKALRLMHRKLRGKMHACKAY